MVFAVAASLLLIAGGVIWLRPHQQPEQVYATTVGGLKEVRLVDGTRMELNTNTRVHANVTATGRTVTLDSGEAYFDVVHGRPVGPSRSMPATGASPTWARNSRCSGTAMMCG